MTSARMFALLAVLVAAAVFPSVTAEGQTGCAASSTCASSSGTALLQQGAVRTKAATDLAGASDDGGDHDGHDHHADGTEHTDGDGNVDRDDEHDGMFTTQWAPPSCTSTRTTLCCGDGTCGGPETSSNCAADCTGSPSSSPDPSIPSSTPDPSIPSSSPSPSIPTSSSDTECTTVPAERPTVPTLCTSQNMGCCECGSGDLKTYVFWPGTGTAQRCFHVYNMPASAPSGGAQPVVLHMDGYSGGKKGSGTQGDMGIAAKYYGFTTITLGNLLKDGAGGFGLEFGNNGIVNDANLKPCASTDSREIVYLEGVFQFIADNPTLLGVNKVYTEGFSQNSMFAAYTAVCFASKVAGVWQGGSGLSKTAHDPVAPGYQGQCSFTSQATHGSSCCAEEFCTDCQYWPIYPKTCSHKLVDCIHAYTDDTIACGSDWNMYEAMVSEGNDARLLSFPGGTSGSGIGGHQDPKNKWAWLTGCLGLVTACSSTCEASFASCVTSATDSTGYEKFQSCETQIKNAQLSGCTSGCAPTLEMLKLSETPVVSLSEGTFGTTTGLPQVISAPRPDCKKAFGKFTDRTAGPTPKCSAPSSFTLSAENPSNSVCNSIEGFGQ